MNNRTDVLSKLLKEKGPVLFLFSFLLILVLAPLIQKGSFIDAMLYKTVAFNYAEGLSEFWSMKYTNSSMRFFCEQPPLYFYCLALLFKLLGSSYLTDRLFTFLLFTLLLFVIDRICAAVFKRSQPYFYLTVFFLLTIQVFCWTFVNQVIETQVIVLSALSIWVFVNYIKNEQIIYLLLFPLLLILLFLTKGFQSCFLIVLPFTYTLLKKFKAALVYFSAFAFFSFLCVLVFFLKAYAPSMIWYNCYYAARLVLTLNNVGATTTNHFEIIVRFFTETVGVFFVLIVLIGYVIRKKQGSLKNTFRYFFTNKLAVALLVCALAGSWPYALSLVQRGFYLVPAFLCFVLALVIGFKRYWLFLFNWIEGKLEQKALRYFLLVLTGLALIYFAISVTQFKREKELSEDLEMILPYLQNGEEILVQEDVWNYFNLHSYLYMAKQCNLVTNKGTSRFLISHKNDRIEDDSLRKVKIKLTTQELDFYYLPE